MIYIFVYLVSMIFAYFAERSKDKGVIILCSIISILAPSILGGLRAHGMGIDTVTYGLPHALRALASPSLADFISNNRSEPGYEFVCYMAMKTFGHVNWCYFFYQLITMSGVYIGAYKHRKIAHVPLTLLMFFLFYYQFIYSAMRQGMAVAIIFMGIDTLEKKHYGKFLLYVFTAAMFHYSAVITIALFMILYFIATSEYINHRKYMQFIIILSGISVIIFIRYFMTLAISMLPVLAKYQHYVDEEQYTQRVTNTSMLLLFCGEILMLLFYGKKASKLFTGSKREYSDFNINFYTLNIIFLMTYRTFIKIHSGRILFYSELANLIVLSALSNFVKEKHLRVMVTIAVIAVASIFFVRKFIFIGFYRTWPYRSIL